MENWKSRMQTTPPIPPIQLGVLCEYKNCPHDEKLIKASHAVIRIGRQVFHARCGFKHCGL